MCGGKGAQKVEQSQTYTPNPVAQGAITNALGQVQNVSQTPFQTPVAPVANFSQDQQRAFDLTNQAQGMAQPYFQQAANYFSPQGASQFFNPMAEGVMSGMKDIFGQQMKQTTGNLTQQAGGVGADRIAVGQSELGKQQGLAAGQTLSDLYARAQQQAQGAAFGLGSLGPAMQNSALQGAQSLLGTGGLQQQLSQAQMNAPYQNILQQIMWPYQNAQFNATNTAALAPGLGGTTNGQTTYPAASPWGSIIGAGAAGLGAFGGAGGFSGMFGGSNGGYNQYNPEPYGANADTDPSLIGARGGRVPERADGGGVPGYDDGGDVSDAGGFGGPDHNFNAMVSDDPMGGAGGSLIPQQHIQPIKPVIPQLQQPQQKPGGGDSGWGQAIGTAAKMAMMFINRGGRVNPRYASGGGVGGMGLMSMLEGGGPGGLLQMLQGGKPMGLMSALQGGDKGEEKEGAPSSHSDLSLLGLPHFADGGMPQPPPQGGFGTGKGGLMSMLGGAGGLAQHMPQMGGAASPAGSPSPQTPPTPGGLMGWPTPPAGGGFGTGKGGLMSMLNAGLRSAPQFSGANGGPFAQLGSMIKKPGGMGGLHAFDPRSYMQPRGSARGGPVGYAEGGETDVPQGDDPFYRAAMRVRGRGPQRSDLTEYPDHYGRLVHGLESLRDATDPVPPPTGSPIHDLGQAAQFSAGVLGAGRGAANLMPNMGHLGTPRMRLPDGSVMRRNVTNGREFWSRDGRFIGDPDTALPPWRADGGGVPHYAEGGAPGDELIPPPYDPRELPRAINPNLTSLMGGEKEPPPPQIEGMPPGKVRSFEDPRLMGAVPELAGLAAPMMPAGEIAGLARPATTLAREALERAPGIVNRALGKPAERFGNPLPAAGLGATGALGGSSFAEAQTNKITGGPTDEEKAEIGGLETKLGALDTEIARLRRLNTSDEQFNQKSAKARGDRVRAQAKLDEINGTVRRRKEALEDVGLSQHRKEVEAEEPFRIKHKDFATNLPMYSMAGAGGTGLLSGMLNKGKMLKPVGAGLLAGGAEGTLTSMGPSLYDMGNLPLGSKHQKEASDQIWGPVDRGDSSFYKNRVAGDAALNAGIAGTAAAVGSYGPKLLGRVGQYARSLMGARASGAAAPIEGAVAKAAAPAEEAVSSAVSSAGAKAPTKMIKTEHRLPDGTTVNRYVNPNNPKDVRWRQGQTWLKKGDYPKLEAEARGGRISGNPYFADGGSPSFNDMWGDVDSAVDSGTFDPGSSGDYFGEEAKQARNFIPTPRPRPEMPDDGASPVAFAGRQPPMGGMQPPRPPLPVGGNPYGAPAPQEGAPQQGGRFIDSPWAALMNAGLGMMSASGKRDARGLPTPTLSAIGEGGMQGLQMLGSQREAAMKQQTVDQASRRLQQQADFHADNYNKLTMAQKVQLMRPHEIGVGRYGEKMMGLPKLGPNGELTGEYTPLDPATGLPMPGQTVRPGGSGNTPVQTPRERLVQSGQERYEQENVPVMAQLAQYERDNPRPGINPDVLSDMKPEDARVVKAIADGRQKFIPNRRNDARGQYLMSKVHEYDPNVDETTFQRRQRTTNFFAVGTQGGGGQNIAAMNTWSQHMDEYLRLTQELDLGRFPSINAAKNFFIQQGVGPKVIQDKLGELEIARKAVADEGAKVFAGSNSALADRQHWEEKFALNTPSSVALAKAKEAQKLVEGRLSSVANQYNEGMRTSHEPLNFLAPKTREVMDRIRNSTDKYIKPGETAQPQQPQPPQQPAGIEGQMKQFKQGWGVFRNGKWQPSEPPGTGAYTGP